MNVNTSQFCLNGVTVETRLSWRQEKIQYQIKLSVRDGITEETGCSLMTALFCYSSRMSSEAPPLLRDLHVPGRLPPILTGRRSDLGLSRY